MIDVASATARANGRIRGRMTGGGRSYLMAVRDETDIVARLIADYVLKGAEQYEPWLAEYLVLGQMRDRALESYRQERAELAERRAASVAEQLADAAPHKVSYLHGLGYRVARTFDNRAAAEQFISDNALVHPLPGVKLYRLDYLYREVAEVTR